MVSGTSSPLLVWKDALEDIEAVSLEALPARLPGGVLSWDPGKNNSVLGLQCLDGVEGELAQDVCMQLCWGYGKCCADEVLLCWTPAALGDIGVVGLTSSIVVGNVGVEGLDIGFLIDDQVLSGCIISAFLPIFHSPPFTDLLFQAHNTFFPLNFLWHPSRLSNSPLLASLLVWIHCYGHQFNCFHCPLSCS